MTSKVTSSTVSEVKFASETDNINPLTLSDIKNGFAGCSGAGIPMTSANFNAVLNWITENIGLQEDIVVETIKGKKYLITKAKDGSRAKIEISKLIEDLRDSGVLTADDFGNGFKFNKKTNKYDVALGKSLTFNENGDIDIKSNPSGGVVINNDGLAELALSKERGNLLEKRKDGLYYGIEAPVDTSNLYVSSSQGDDGNTGTRNSPLRTIAEAMRRNQPNQLFQINLFEDDIHEWRSSHGRFSERWFRILPYGPKYDQVIQDNPLNSIHWARSSQLTRPKLLLVADRVNQYGFIEAWLQTDFNKTSEINGCIVSMRKEGSQAIFDNPSFFGGSVNKVNLLFRGCEFTNSIEIPFLQIGTPESSLIIDHCYINGMTNFGYIEPNGRLNIGFRSFTDSDGFGKPITGTTQRGNQSNLTYAHNSTRQQVLGMFSGNNTVQRAGIIY